jgi:hypothetical protein
MTAHLNVPFETVVELVDQLPIEQQHLLLQRIQGRIHRQSLSVEEKIQLLRAAQINADVNQEPSPRREDWYDDDGR